MGSGSTSSSSTKPWKGQQQYLKSLYSRADELYGQDNYQYGPNRVTGFDPASERSFEMAEQRSQGTGLERAAQGEVQSTLEGKYLNPESNPGLQSYVRGAKRNYYGAVNSLGSRFEGSGRSGSGAQGSQSNVTEENFARGMGNVYGGLYEQERGRMMGAASMAPQLGEMDWRNISGLRNVGMQREEQSQRELDDLVARFQQEQYGNQEKLSEFQSMLGAPVMQSKSGSFAMSLIK